MTDKIRVLHPLPKIVLCDREGGFFESADALNKRCKEHYGDAFYDSKLDCCVRLEEPVKPGKVGFDVSLCKTGNW